MKFVVYAQLPPALVKFLRSSGHDAYHVGDIGLLHAKDPPIWEYSEKNGCVIIAKDEDFALMRIIRTTGPQVVWLRVGNCSNRALLQWFAPVFGDIVNRLQGDEMLIEVI